MKKPNLTAPAAADSRIKVLIHAASGTGKTRWASTFPKPLIFDFEEGTSSVSEQVQVIAPGEFMVNGKFNPQTVIEYLQWAATKDADGVETIVIDSVTELQELFLAVTIPNKPDPRQAYGEWSSYVRTMMSLLRGIDKNFVVIARTKMGDNFEGEKNTLLPQISPAAWTNVPALVDYGFYMTQKKEGIGPTAKIVPVLVTRSTAAWTKTRRPLPAEIVNPTFAVLQEAIARASQEPTAK